MRPSPHILLPPLITRDDTQSRCLAVHLCTQSLNLGFEFSTVSQLFVVLLACDSQTLAVLLTCPLRIVSSSYEGSSRAPHFCSSVLICQPGYDVLEIFDLSHDS